MILHGDAVAREYLGKPRLLICALLANSDDRLFAGPTYTGERLRNVATSVLLNPIRAHQHDGNGEPRFLVVFESAIGLAFDTAYSPT
jgi:hypothetical protein